MKGRFRVLFTLPDPIGSGRRRPIRALGRNEQGHALIEAALIFPILIGLFLGASEFSEAFIVNRRIAAAANTAADLVARVQSVTTDDLNALKPMIDETIKPYPISTVGLVISSIVSDGSNATTVAWSYAQGPGVTAYPSGSGLTLPTQLTQPNTSIIVAEVRYTFRSTLSTMIVGDVPMRSDAYQRPRFTWAVAKR
jgi:Flp pilus assembly protein TadG